MDCDKTMFLCGIYQTVTGCSLLTFTGFPIILQVVTLVTGAPSTAFYVDTFVRTVELVGPALVNIQTGVVVVVQLVPWGTQTVVRPHSVLTAPLTAPILFPTFVYV